MTDEFPTPRAINLFAAAGLIVSSLVAAAGMFLLPTLVDAGASFLEAFVAVSVLEFAAAVGAGLSAMELYRDTLTPENS